MTDPKNARKLVEDELTPRMARELWSGNYARMLPITVQYFDLAAVLPSIFYMFRFGYRRGVGEFLNTFGSEGTPANRRKSVTVERITKRLTDNDTKGTFNGFDDKTEQAILSDLLLCFCFSNVKNNLGRDQQVQRVLPVHYMASWIDLPQRIGDLRYVPEMIVAMLANQKQGIFINNTEEKDREKSRFPVGQPVGPDYRTNLLLESFSQGVTAKGPYAKGDKASDDFDEKCDSIGLDQLLMVRLAQELKAAPEKTRVSKKDESDQISNQRPIAKQAAEYFSEDIRRFLRSYANCIPRHTLLGMLESCMAIGLTTVLSSTAEVLLQWQKDGRVPEKQQPAHLFVDCSNGVDKSLRDQAEQSMNEFMRRMDYVPTIFMMLRLLQYEALIERTIKRVVEQESILKDLYAIRWLNLLGDILHKKHEKAEDIHRTIERYIEKLKDSLEDDYAEAARILSENNTQSNPVCQLAQSLVALQGRNISKMFRGLIDSSLYIGRSNGIAIKRTTTSAVSGSSRRKREVRSLVFTDPVLDYLVHRLLLSYGNNRLRSLSFKEFVNTLRKRYGFYVDTAPPGLDISNELLQRNRAILERRLRDLSLLVGVNDAESMKRLQPRFTLSSTSPTSDS